MPDPRQKPSCNDIPPTTLKASLPLTCFKMINQQFAVTRLIPMAPRTFVILTVLVASQQSHAALVTSSGMIHASIRIDGVVDSGGNPVSTTGLDIMSEPYDQSDDFGFGSVVTSAFASANGGSNPNSLGVADTIQIDNSIEIELNGPGTSEPFAFSTVGILLDNRTGADVTINFSVNYQLYLESSRWSDPETISIIFGDLDITYSDAENVVFLEHELSDPDGGITSISNSASFAIDLVSDQDTTLFLSSFLSGQASVSAVPEPSSLAVITLVSAASLLRRCRRRKNPAIS